MYWTRHMILTTTQAGFHYAQYPLDTQKVHLRFESYSLPKSLMVLSYPTDATTGQSLSTQLYANTGAGSPNLKGNSQWSLLSTTAVIQDQNNAISGSPRYFSQGQVDISFKRNSNGILIRLGFPILLTTCVTGFIFWASPGDRLTNTVTLLLTISALYIVIFSSIPLVGIITSMDKFVFGMFLILIVSIICHVIHYGLTR